MPTADPAAAGGGEAHFPTTRYQGSKRRLLGWLWDSLRELPFESALDAFGGTGAVSYLLKAKGKAVTYNDVLRFNADIGRALIENDSVTLSEDDVQRVVAADRTADYPDFIRRAFTGIYYTDAENAWLDQVIWNIDHRLDHPYKVALARYALYQACLAKRPYNLFHRANLNLRQADVPRSFGNKALWDRPFEALFRRYAEEGNRAVFGNGRAHQVLCGDVLAAPIGADLVYIDPPYVGANGAAIDYHAFYHFLEGMADYTHWPDRVDYGYKHRPLRRAPSDWGKPDQVLAAFERVFARFRASILVVSYRADGLPTPEALIGLLGRVKGRVRMVEKPQQYALSARPTREILVIGE